MDAEGERQGWLLQRVQSTEPLPDTDYGDTHIEGDVQKDVCATHGVRRDSVVGIGRCLL